MGHQIEVYSEYFDPWCEYNACMEPDPDDVEADDRISSGIDDLENEYWWYYFYFGGKFHDDEVQYRIRIHLYYDDLCYND